MTGVRTTTQAVLGRSSILCYFRTTIGIRKV
ncbi:hypothetical protein L3X38_015371 [Prunus dulcis]|uniref:Uncharacterized protein n=1 Tax=Prunus dulcis TaxID=3755 RepID=A0AAD4WSJ7_PRUDU|nr:hypothetical protein L3X38_015371 [Prunus dulcis]